MRTAIIALLGVAVGFGATVWTILSWVSWRERQLWHAFWYSQLALAEMIASAVVGGRLIGYPFTLPPPLSAVLLLPIVAIPPVLQFHAWIAARKLRNGR